MEFIPSEPFDSNVAQRRIWSVLRQALANDEGVCYYRYPIFSGDRSRREPDILLLHREWGLYVIECKGFEIENVSRIDYQMDNGKLAQERGNAIQSGRRPNVHGAQQV